MRQASVRLTSEREPIFDEIIARYNCKGETDSESLWRLLQQIYQEPILDKSSLPSSTPQSEQPRPPRDLDHLNICDPNGAIQVYLRKRNAETERIKKRMAEAYLVEKARQNAKTEGERERAEIREGERLLKRTVSSRKPTIDWGNSVGVEPEWNDR